MVLIHYGNSLVVKSVLAFNIYSKLAILDNVYEI